MCGQIPGRTAGYEGGDRILTDDHAPVELLGMRPIDQIIEQELAWYKDIYHEQGLQGLLDNVL